MGVLVSDLQLRIRRAAKDENSDYATDAELRSYINTYAQELYDKLVAARGQEYFRKAQELNTIAGQYQYALPVDFYEMVALLVNQAQVNPAAAGSWGAAASTATSNWYQVAPYMLQEQASLMNSWGRAHPSAWRYRLLGSQDGPDGTGGPAIEIRPTPQQACTVRLEYLPQAIQPAGTSLDYTVEGVNGWEEYIVLSVAIRLLAEEEVDTSAFQAERARIEDRIQLLAGQRDAGQPQHVQDTRGNRLRGRNSRGPWGFGGPGWGY
jgi:hypothetical protein